MKLLYYNLLVFIISMLLATVAAEIYLRADGRYADLVNENLVPSRAIWDRPANTIQHRKHSDLGYKVEIKFNEFQIRNHHGLTLNDVEEYQGKLIAAFGDSFTENRRIEDRFTFTTLLNNILKPDFMVLNMGVDSYGLDQSYIKYLDFKARKQLDHVFYIFYKNDLRNIYENQLFDFSDGKVGNPVQPRTNHFVSFIRQFHVSYLLIDSYARLKARVAEETYNSEKLNKRIVEKFSPEDQRKKARDSRFRDEYGGSMVKNLLSETPTEHTLEWANRFRLLLDAWQHEVETNGGRFTIIVVPNQLSTDLAEVLFGKQFKAQTLYLADYFPEGYSDFRFVNDAHWNEKGNLRAAQAIAQWGADQKLWPDKKSVLDSLTEQTEAAIEKLYQQ